jgi:hypothetical protein
MSIAWVGPRPFELEPWTVVMHAVGEKRAPRISIQAWDDLAPQFRCQIERRAAEGWEAMPAAEPTTRGESSTSKELWCELRIADAQVTGLPGDYRLRMWWSGQESWPFVANAEPACSDWLAVQVMAHPGNREAMTTHALDLWHPLALITGSRPVYPAIGDAAAVETHWLNAIAWAKTPALSPGLRCLGAMFDVEVTLAAAGYRVDQRAATTASLWSRAQQQLEHIGIDGWTGPTGGLAADVLRARIVCARALGNTEAAEALTANLRRYHPHAWLPADPPLRMRADLAPGKAGTPPAVR